jgi:hypothetical protein
MTNEEAMKLRLDVQRAMKAVLKQHGLLEKANIGVVIAVPGLVSGKSDIVCVGNISTDGLRSLFAAASGIGDEHKLGGKA